MIVKFLVTYATEYGNTAKIAEMVSTSLSNHGSSALKPISKVTSDDLNGISLLVIGSPTQGGQATKPTQEFINTLPAELFTHCDVAVFDTRYNIEEQKLPLRLLMKTIGYVAPKMAKALQQKGGQLISEPQGFIVTGKEGPLGKSEHDRAQAWASNLALTVK